MDTLHVDIPVAMVVFNRLDCVQANLNSIRKATPPKLYVISDGPRKGFPEDIRKVQEVRLWIEQHVDWKCEVIKIYAEKNMGCDARSVSGYNEVFRHEEMAILIEDDSVPVPDFYKFCEEMLLFYKDNHRIMMVTGGNLIPEYSEDDKDYFFSAVPIKCAWATYKWAWEMHTKVLEGKFKISKNWLRKSLNKKTRYFYEANFFRCRMLQSMNWDAEWDCAMLANQGLGIVPKVNMIQYLGANRCDATHNSGDSRFAHLPIGSYKDKIRFRKDALEQDKKFDQLQQRYMIEGTRLFLIRSQIAYIIHKFFPGIYNKLKNYYGLC